MNAAKTTKTIGKVAGKTAQETAEEVAERVAKETAQQAAERAARETAQEATERAARETAVEAVEKVAKETAQETAEEAAERVARETAQEATERAVRETAERSAKETAQETTKETAKTDDITTVKRGDNNGADGSGVKIRGEVDETKVGEVKKTELEDKTVETESNKIRGDEKQTSSTVSQTGVQNISKVTKYELTNKLRLHITMVDPFVPRKRGIGGAHKKDVFIKNDIKIISETPHPSINGVSKIEYQMPKRDKTGAPIPGEYQDGVPKAKTVYDSNIISTDEYLSRGLEAANNAAFQYENGILPREWVGIDNNGITWHGYCENGEIKSMYPE